MSVIADFRSKAEALLKRKHAKMNDPAQRIIELNLFFLEF